eukprot:223451_1
MPLIYALVARGTNVLAEHTSDGFRGNFATVTRVVLDKVPTEDAQRSYVYDAFVFHYLVSDGLTFLCVADQEFAKNIAFTFLNDIKSRFFATYGDSGQNAASMAMNADFGMILKKQQIFQRTTKKPRSIGAPGTR